MQVKELKNLRYSNLLVSVKVTYSQSSSWISFVHASPSVSAIPLTLTWTNKDGTFKRFRSHAALYRALSEIFTWPVHPDLVHRDQLNLEPTILVL